MSKVLVKSTKGNIISFNCGDNAHYQITPEGIPVSVIHLTMLQDRLGGQIQTSPMPTAEQSAKDVKESEKLTKKTEAEAKKEAKEAEKLAKKEAKEAEKLAEKEAEEAEAPAVKVAEDEAVVKAKAKS